MPNRVYRTDEHGTREVEPSRAPDRDFWARLDVIAARYKLVWLFWTSVATAGGWLLHTYLEPLTSVPVLQAQQTVIIRRLDQADSSRSEITQVLKVFGKIICRQMTPDDRYKYDIRCAELPPPTIKNPGGY